MKQYFEWKHPAGYILDAHGHPVGRWYQLPPAVVAKMFNTDHMKKKGDSK